MDPYSIELLTRQLLLTTASRKFITPVGDYLEILNFKHNYTTMNHNYQCQHFLYMCVFEVHYPGRFLIVYARLKLIISY